MENGTKYLQIIHRHIALAGTISYVKKSLQLNNKRFLKLVKKLEDKSGRPFP